MDLIADRAAAVPDRPEKKRTLPRRVAAPSARKTLLAIAQIHIPSYIVARYGHTTPCKEVITLENNKYQNEYTQTGSNSTASNSQNKNSQSNAQNKKTESNTQNKKSQSNAQNRTSSNSSNG